MRAPAAAIVLTIAAVSACSTGGSTNPTTPTPATSVPSTSVTAPSTSASVPPSSSASRPTVSARPTTSSAKPSPSTSSAKPKKSRTKSETAIPLPPPAPPGSGPVIALDAGHAPTTSGTDPETGLRTNEYENDPEMEDVWDVTKLVQKELERRGYRVVLTKQHEYDHITLDQRAARADAAHAALAVSIHDQAGSNGGIGFDSGNNTVYYQKVGDYRETPSGKKIVFEDERIARLSKQYGQIFQQRRASVEGHSVKLMGDIGYDAGTRGLAPGNIWIVQLLSHVPWIYNEAGGNSAGRTGLSDDDKQRYAAGIVASVISCVPID